MARALPLLAPRDAAGPGARGVEAVSPGSVRVSLTDRCDLACVYCRPDRGDGYLETRLDLAGWRTILETLRAEGVRRVRVTGGEPLLHREVVPFVELLAAIGFEDVALTTNATRLEALAEPLRAAGLQRLNVSIDSLDPTRFQRLTRGGDLAAVLRGLDAAARAGFSEIKLNCVVLAGENEDEIAAITDWAWDRRWVPRFLELMAIGEGAKVREKYVPYARILAALGGRVVVGEALREDDRGPAKYLVARHDPSLRVGFITGHSDTYCGGCDRLRVTADGTFRPCLATNDGVSAAAAARDGDAAVVAARLREAWAQKPDGTTFRGCSEASAADVSIRAIGG